MIATIADRLADDCDVCLAKPFAQISAQLSSPDSGRIPVNVVLSIDFPPPIKHGVAWQLLGTAETCRAASSMTFVLAKLQHACEAGNPVCENCGVNRIVCFTRGEHSRAPFTLR